MTKVHQPKRLAQAVEIGHFARTLVQAIAEAATELAEQPTEEAAHVLIGLMEVFKTTAQGEQPV